VISGFRRKVDESCVLLDYYAASSGNFLLTFWGIISVPSSGVKYPPLQKTPEDKTNTMPQKSVKNNYYYSLCNNPEERRFQRNKYFATYHEIKFVPIIF